MAVYDGGALYDMGYLYDSGFGEEEPPPEPEPQIFTSLPARPLGDDPHRLVTKHRRRRRADA